MDQGRVIHSSAYWRRLRAKKPASVAGSFPRKLYLTCRCAHFLSCRHASPASRFLNLIIQTPTSPLTTQNCVAESSHDQLRVSLNSPSSKAVERIAAAGSYIIRTVARSGSLFLASSVLPGMMIDIDRRGILSEG